MLYQVSEQRTCALYVSHSRPTPKRLSLPWQLARAASAAAAAGKHPHPVSAGLILSFRSIT